MNIQTTIDDKRIEQLLFGHRGSVSDWLHLVNMTDQARGLGAGVDASWDREGDPEGEAKGKGHFSYTDIERGIAAWAGSPEGLYQWGCFREENDDDVTFDVAWQFIIFGKLVYA